MKKILKLILFYALVILFAPILVFARGHRLAYANPEPRNTSPTPPIVTIPAPTSTNLQIGYFLPPAGVPSAYTMLFTDGLFIGSGNEVIFLEPPYSDSQVLAGSYDATLKSFSLGAAKYPNVILALNEEGNCVGNDDRWSIGTDGNTLTSSIETIQHEAAVAREYDPNIKIAEDLNADNCNGTYPTASYVAPGMDILGLDDFSDGSESWSQLFQPAINNLKGLGIPIDILSEGASGNQAAFVQQTVAGATANGINLVLWFNAGAYAAPASTLIQL